MNIYVSNLGFDVSDVELKSLFSDFGAVESAKVITDKITNRSRGFGFVEMPNKAEAVNAISSLNGHSIDNRQLKVSESIQREDRGNNSKPSYSNSNSNRRW